MPSVSFSIPKYRHHKGSGQAFVQINGKRHYLGRYGTPESKQRYSQFVVELAVRPAAASAVVTKNAKPVLTVVELCAAYLDFAETYYRKNGQITGTVSLITRATTLLCDLYGRTTAADFGPLALMAVQQSMAMKGLARHYVNDTIDKIRRVFKWGVSRELISASVYHGLTAVEGLKKGRTAAREPAPILPVEEALVEATLPHLPKIVADMVRFQRLTGCRPGEVCQLRPMDLDRSGEVWQYRPGSHKTEHHGRERVIFIGPKAQAIIMPYLLRTAAAHCFSPAESVQAMRDARQSARKTPIHRGNRPGTNRKAKPQRTPKESYTKDSYARAIRRGVDKANTAILEDAKEFQIDNPTLLAYWAPNRLRHTRATEVRKQFGLEATQVVLGHAKADVTQVYAERDSALAVEVMKKIG